MDPPPPAPATEDLKPVDRIASLEGALAEMTRHHALAMSQVWREKEAAARACAEHWEVRATPPGGAGQLTEDGAAAPPELKLYV